ncbi:DUF4239 domain-containing protein [Streptomyces sp. NPDC101151]|uniref:bestrophin-like domain n=1 Tax=Streptomyces sp. NPDC101151 TaxID=3366115 RepID=UPI0038122772
MPIYGYLLVLGGAAASVLVLLVLSRYVPGEKREPHNDVLGFVYAVVGVIYAVVLALVVIGLWETQEKARADTYTESDALIDLYWYGRSLPPADAARIEDLAQRYPHTVITEEWPLLAQHRSSRKAWDEQAELRQAVYRQQPKTLGEQARYQQALQAVSTMSDTRRQRVNESAAGLPSLLWAVLVLGGLITVAFAMGFGMHSLRAHSLIVFGAALTVGSLLLCIYELNYPFVRSIRVNPDAFELAIARMKALSAMSPR